MRLYLIRHGETILNEKRCYYGFTDPSLNERGIRQAECLKKILGKIPFDQAICSPLIRAKNTAEIVLGEKKNLLMTADDLKEQNFGIFEGKTYEELRAEYPDELDAWNQNFSTYRIPGGESFSDVRHRVDDFVRKLPTGSGTMLLAAHKGTLGHLLASLLGLPLEGYWNFVFDQGAYSCVDLEDGYAIVRKLNQSAEQ